MSTSLKTNIGDLTQAVVDGETFEFDVYSAQVNGEDVGASSATITMDTDGDISVAIKCDIDDFISADTVVEAFGVGKLIEEIGIKKVKDYLINTYNYTIKED